ncbi:MAG: nuclear transport factor 2 family protein [Asgard group archaeon]|nr:nuclear transport factor 2 family protein [Asgard group archaeon]
MEERYPKIIALLYNEQINARSVDGCAKLMTEDHVFIDILGKVHNGKEHMLQCWEEFFDEYPDYQNVFTRVENQENFVILLGYSTCSHDPLDGPAVWTAKIRDNLIAEWRIYEDTPENRKMPGVQQS